MMAGGLILLLAAVRLPSELKSTPKAATATASQLCVGVPCRANADRRPARGYEVPSIAVDPQDPRHQVVGDENLVGGRCGWHVTFDGGDTWTDGVFDIPPEYGKCTLDSAGLLPMGNVAMGATGASVYAVFDARRAGLHGEAAGSGGEGILLVTSTDGGKSFDTARPILPGGNPDLSYVRPQMIVSPSSEGVDRILLTAWGCGPGRCTTGYFIRSDDAGKTFTPPLLITPDPGGNSPSPPAIAADGTVYLTFLRRFDGGATDLVVARSGDDGKTFDDVVVDKEPTIGIQYDSAKIVVDPGQKDLYMVFADMRDNRPEVFFRRSRDKGTTWDRAVRLHTSPAGSAYSPAVSVAPNGRIDVIFYRETRKNILDAHYTYSDDNGASFALDQRLNDKTIDRELGYWAEVGDDSIPAVTSTNAAAYFAWSDTRDATKVTNTQEILTKRIDFPKPTAP